MKFSFVIPAYNNYKLLHTLLWDIYKNCSTPYEVIVTDDGNDKETLDGLKWWANEAKLLPIKHYRHAKPKGFLRNSNYGLELATGNVVCLVSTDVRIHKNILLDTGGDLWGGRYLDFDTGWNKFGKNLFPYLEGWLLMARKSVWEQLGYFDERFVPHDYEDVDISTKARELGIPLTHFVDGYVTHLGAQSIGYSSDREEITKINREKFREKWVK